MPHSYTLTARVSTAWIIKSSLCYVYVCGKQWDHTETAAAVAAYQLSQPL